MGVLIVSPLFDNLQNTNHAPRSHVVYTIAPYGGAGEFSPGKWKSIDIGGPNNFYASNCMKAPDGRWLLWGMNLGGGSPGHHWTTNLSLPRVLTLRPDGLLGQDPPIELQGLRRAHWGERDKALNGEYLVDVKSNACEIIAEFEVGDARIVGMDVRASNDFRSKNRIAYDTENAKLRLDGYSVDFELLEGENLLRLHAFVDRSVLEVFVNRRECGTLRPFHNIEDKAIRLFTEGGAARIRSIDIWEMGSIWSQPTQD
jgi:beta-fructofuranosidase